MTDVQDILNSCSAHQCPAVDAVPLPPLPGSAAPPPRSPAPPALRTAGRRRSPALPRRAGRWAGLLRPDAAHGPAPPGAPPPSAPPPPAAPPLRPAAPARRTAAPHAGRRRADQAAPARPARRTAPALPRHSRPVGGGPADGPCCCAKIKIKIYIIFLQYIYIYYIIEWIYLVT